MPRGGRRPGAGRKPKDAALRAIDGGAAKGRTVGAPVIALPTTNSDQVPEACEEFQAPDSLTREQRQIWLQLAPFAFANRTLTRGTALAFERLCKHVALERELERGELAGGSDHRGMIQRVDAELARFMLAPFGKAVYERPAVAPTAPTSPAGNPLARFLKRRA